MHIGRILPWAFQSNCYLGCGISSRVVNRYPPSSSVLLPPNVSFSTLFPAVAQLGRVLFPVGSFAHRDPRNLHRKTLIPGRYTSVVSTQHMTAMDLIELLVKIVAIGGGLGAVYKFIYEIRENRKQRHAELQWKRANAAKELVDDIHKNERAIHAVRMLSWCTEKEGKDYEQAPGHKGAITS